MSTATIYAHRFDAANDEKTGIIGGSEAWERSEAAEDLYGEWSRLDCERARAPAS